MILTISGFSGAGKDTIAQEIVKHGFNFVTSHTTRPMRTSESQGYPYHFISTEEMLAYNANNELVQMKEYYTTDGIWYYAIHKSEMDHTRDYVVVLDLKGVEDIKEVFNDVFSVFIDVDPKTRFDRAVHRDSDIDLVEWGRRLTDDLTIFKNVECDLRVTNDTDVNDCVNNILKGLKDARGL